MEDGEKSRLVQLTRQCDNELHTEAKHGRRFILFFPAVSHSGDSFLIEFLTLVISCLISSLLSASDRKDVCIIRAH